MRRQHTLTIVFGATVLAVSFSSCKLKSPNVTRASYGDDIEPSIRQAANATLGGILEDLKGRDTGSLYGKCAEDFRANVDEETFGLAVEKMGKELDKRRIETWQQYYMENSSVGGSKVNIFYKGLFSEAQQWPMQFNTIEAVAPRMFLSLHKVTSATEKSVGVLALLLSRDEGDWKLHNMNMGLLTISKMNALNYLSLSDLAFKKRDYLAAVTAIDISRQLATPTPFISYKKLIEIAQFQQKIHAQFDKAWTLPKAIEIPDKSIEILGFSNIFTKEDGSILRVRCLTKTPVDSVEELGKEVPLVKRFINESSPMLKDISPQIAISFLNEVPMDKERQYKMWTEVVSLNEPSQSEI